jgi:hypothetical protein
MRIRSEYEPREWNLDTIQESTTRSEDSVSTVWPDTQYDTTRYEPKAIQHNTHTYSKHRTVRYNTIRYELRAIVLQYNTYNHVHTIRIFPRGVQHGMIWYDTIRTTSKPCTVRYDTIWYDCMNHKWSAYIRQALHSTCGSYCISSGITDTIWTARMPIANREILFTIREIFFYAPRFFTIRSTVRTLFPRGVIRSYFNITIRSGHDTIWYLLMELYVYPKTY